jgi:hypothetical protein
MLPLLYDVTPVPNIYPILCQSKVELFSRFLRELYDQDTMLFYLFNRQLLQVLKYSY